jgi:D-threo-aldose 1-dehydrogenase
MKLTSRKPLGRSGLEVPQIIYGTSYLGNLYRSIPYGEKLELMKKWFECTETPVVIDSAGKYGAGLALEIIGRGLDDLDVDPADIIISNKLGWYRVPLTADEPAFEPGAWKDLENDCILSFGYEGIMNCFEQGNDLLGGKYQAEVVSVHDPDEYLFAASDPADRDKRFIEVLESYRALYDLKKGKKVKAVGIGSKDWTIIRELYEHVPFDWVMIANSFTIFSHPEELISFMDLLYENGVGIINSALFHGGFLTGGTKFDYRDVDPATDTGKIIFAWREGFHALCGKFDVVPGDACLHFGISHPAIASIALNTSKAEKMTRNVEILHKEIPGAFWDAMKEEGLIAPDYTYL